MTNRHTGSQWYDGVSAWGAPPPDDLPPPAPVQPQTRPSRRALGLAIAAAAAVLLGLALAGTGAGRMPETTSPVAPGVSLFSKVTVNGVCTKNILGEYSLTATVTGENSTGTAQRGTLWVAWPVTGEATKRYGQTFTIAPGEVAEFPVNKPISAQTWLAAGTCTYGWDPQR